MLKTLLKFLGGIPEKSPVLSNHNVVQVPITNSQKVGGNAVPHRSPFSTSAI